MKIKLTKPRADMLKRIGAGHDYRSGCGSMSDRSAAKRVCLALETLGLIASKSEPVYDANGRHEWTRWVGYEITDAGRAFLAQPNGIQKETT